MTEGVKAPPDLFLDKDKPEEAAKSRRTDFDRSDRHERVSYEYDDLEGSAKDMTEEEKEERISRLREYLVIHGQEMSRKKRRQEKKRRTLFALVLLLVFLACSFCTYQITSSYLQDIQVQQQERGVNE